MLKHIKDIRSPIVVAQQKHAARKANSVISNDSVTTTAATIGHNKGARSINRPPKLEVNDLQNTPSIMSALSPQPGWPDHGAVSPGDHRGEEPLASAGTQPPNTATSAGTPMTNGHDGLKSPEPPLGSSREMPVPSTSGVSYAVAIYPYMAEQDDEFDVVV